MIRFSRREGLSLMVGASQVAILGAASSAFGLSPITLAPIYMWADYEGNGEWKVTDTAVGGKIASSSGGTLPAFPITIDPTSYVQGATGPKTSWTAQFRGSTRGMWTRLGSGDYQFTPGTSAGYDNSQYRVSDDGGSTWSEWQTVQTLVLDRSLAPAPYFLAEDYDGSNMAKLNAARDAAVAAGGGTVTTLNRSTVLTAILEHALKPKVHYLFMNVKRPGAKWTDGTTGCTPTGNGQCSGWTPNQNQHIMSGQSNASSIVDSGTRINFVGGTFDNNAFKQALFQTSGDSATPSSNCGTCWPGNHSTADCFNLQFSASLIIQGKSSGASADRAKYGFHGVILKDSAADGIRCPGAGDVIAQDLIFSGCFRGSYAFDGGNTTMASSRARILQGAVDIGTGIDYEVLLWGGNGTINYTNTDDYIEQDFDTLLRETSTLTFSGCTGGPGINIMASRASGAVFTFQGSASNPRGVMRYHMPGGGSGGTFPRSALLAWAGRTPHECTYIFSNTDFITYGTPYAYHGKTYTPAAGQTWRITLGENVDTSYAWRVELTNCTAQVGPDMPAGSKTILLFDTVKALTTTQVIRIDGLTIGSGFAKDAVRLNGQRLEYRNVSHAGYPSATIQQICPGAGEYLPI
jgi:hypothetical protein